MGAWGSGVFENDDAVDWIGDLEADGASKVEEAIDAVMEAAKEGYIEAPDACFALVAAEAVAYAFDNPSPDLDEDHEVIFDKHADAIRALDDINARAMVALDLVMSSAKKSELVALWEEADEDEAEQFRDNVAKLRRRLDA